MDNIKMEHKKIWVVRMMELTQEFICVLVLTMPNIRVLTERQSTEVH